MLDDTQLLRYSRHILLHELDIQGQERLLASSVLIIGAGGLGCPAALYLASSGVGHITIADNDLVELSNLQRQIAHSTNCIGQNKAQSIQSSIQAINSDPQVQVITEHLHAQGFEKLVPQYDVILDCSDSYKTRYALNSACVQHLKPLVSGSAIRFSGQLAVYNLTEDTSGCYACLFPQEDESSNCSCAALGVLSPIVGVIGSLQAVEAIKLLVGLPVPQNMLTLYDALSSRFHQISFHKRSGCPVCGTQ